MGMMTGHLIQHGRRLEFRELARTAMLWYLIKFLTFLSVICAALYVFCFGLPWPSRPGVVFYEWRLGERGWGYQFPITWQDDQGRAVRVDVARNIVAVGPIAGICDWQATTKQVVFYSRKAAIRFESNTRNRLIVLYDEHSHQVYDISAGAASRLRDLLRPGTTEQDIREIVEHEFPVLRTRTPQP